MERKFEKPSISTRIAIDFFTVEAIAFAMYLVFTLYIERTGKADTRTIMVLFVISILYLTSIIESVLFTKRLSAATTGFITSVTNDIYKIADGDLEYFHNSPEEDLSINKECRDETIAQKKALLRLLSTMRDKVNDAKQVASGNLTTQIHINGDKDLLGNAMLEMVINTHRVVNTIVDAGDNIATGAETLSTSSTSLAQGATEQASTIRQLSASIEEVTTQTNTNVQNAERANQFTKRAKAVAEKGNEQMKVMLSAMDAITQTSESIKKIVKAVDDIAFQTNILALNASVEAARAGQQGKGFAVVADEVRILAGKTTDAVKVTTKMIETSIQTVEAGTKIAKDTADALQEIVAAIQKSDSAVDSITASSKEQASAIKQINQGVIQISQVVQGNTVTAEKTSTASKELSRQAAKMQRAASTFVLRRSNQKTGQHIKS